VLGRVKILAIFRTEKDFMIAGGVVLDGKIVDKKKFHISRDKAVVGEGKIEELQQSKVEVEEVTKDREFGMKVKTRIPLVVGDFLEVYDETVKKGELN
ncbi:hypothetical protein D4R52_00155, partial [bacterium]